MLARPSELASPTYLTEHPRFIVGIHRDETRTLANPDYSIRHSDTNPALARNRASFQAFPSSPLSMGPPPPPSAFGRLETSGPHRLSPLSVSTHEPVAISSPTSGRGRYSPYQRETHERRRSSGSPFHRPSPIELPPLFIPGSRTRDRRVSSFEFQRQRLSPSRLETQMLSGVSPVSPLAPSASAGESTSNTVTLPPILPRSPATLEPSTARQRSDSFYSSGSGSGYSLPPIASLDEVPPLGSGKSPSDMDSRAVLKRLALDDATVGRSRLSAFVVEGSHGDSHARPFEPPSREQLWTRRRSLSEPPTVTSVASLVSRTSSC